jgi:hypothetical protein
MYTLSMLYEILDNFPPKIGIGDFIENKRYANFVQPAVL